MQKHVNKLYMYISCIYIIKRIKQTNKQKTNAISFLKKKNNFDHETGHWMRLDLLNS